VVDPTRGLEAAEERRERGEAGQDPAAPGARRVECEAGADLDEAEEIDRGVGEAGGRRRAKRWPGGGPGERAAVRTGER